MDEIEFILSQEETKAPHTNQLIKDSRDFFYGQISAEDLRLFIEDSRLKVQEALKDIEHFPKQDDYPQELLSLHKEIETGYRTFAEGLEEMSVFFSDSDRKHLLDGLEIIILATNKLASLEEITKIAVPKKRILICPKCGEGNSPDGKHCSKCNFTLPRFSEQEDDVFDYTVTSGEMTAVVGDLGEIYTESAHLFELKTVIDGLLNGTKNKKDLEYITKKLDHVLYVQRNRFYNLKIPEEELSFEVMLSRSNFERALKIYEEGLSQISYYLKSDNPSNLVSGLSQVEEASQIFLQVLEQGTVKQE